MNTAASNRSMHEETYTHDIYEDAKDVNENNSIKERARSRSSKNKLPRRYASEFGRVGYEHETGSKSERTENTNGLHPTQSYRSQEERKHTRRKWNEKAIAPGHLAWPKWMSNSTKNHIVALIGEFTGTTMFLFFAYAGTSTANINAIGDFDPSTILYIALSFGFSLTVNAWIFFRISGGLFNPAVTLARLLIRDLEPVRALLVFIGQLTGACFAALLVNTIFPSALSAQTSLAGETTIAQGIWIEAICTAGLVFTILMLAKEKHQATFIAPIGMGLSLFTGELVAVFYTGGSFNPTRSFGPAAVTHEFLSDHWIYWVAPLLGSLLAFAFYHLMEVLEYEMANLGQDDHPNADPTQNPHHELAQVQGDREAEGDEMQAIEEEGGYESVLEEAQSVGVTGEDENHGHVSARLYESHSVDERGERRLELRRNRMRDLEAQRDVEMAAADPQHNLAASIYIIGVREKRRERRMNGEQSALL